MIERRLLASLVAKHAAFYGLDRIWCAALVLHESEGGEQWSSRIEETSALYVRIMSSSRSSLAGFVPPAGRNPSLYDEKIWRASSWGLSQILGETARVMGFKGRYLPELLDPDVNLFWGLGYFAKCLRRAGSGIDKNAQYRSASLFYNGAGNADYPGYVESRMSEATGLPW